jgi:hypothetical protein
MRVRISLGHHCCFALFNGSWPKLRTHSLEKCFENPHFIFCSSFQKSSFEEHRFWHFNVRNSTLLVISMIFFNGFSYPKPCFCCYLVFSSNFTLPKRRFWKAEQTVPNAIPREALSKGVSTLFGLRIVEKCFPGKRIRNGLFGLPKSSFGEHKFFIPRSTEA